MLSCNYVEHAVVVSSSLQAAFVSTTKASTATDFFNLYFDFSGDLYGYVLMTCTTYSNV